MSEMPTTTIRSRRYRSICRNTALWTMMFVGNHEAGWWGAAFGAAISLACMAGTE